MLNAKLLHHLDYADVADRLPEGVGEAEWLVLRGNLARVGEAADWVPVLSGEIDPPEVVPDDKPLLDEAAQVAEDDRLVGRSLACPDRPAEGLDRPQGSCPVPPAETGDHRPRFRSGNGTADQADRPGQRHCERLQRAASA